MPDAAAVTQVQNVASVRTVCSRTRQGRVIHFSPDVPQKGLYIKSLQITMETVNGIIHNHILFTQQTLLTDFYFIRDSAPTDAVELKLKTYKVHWPLQMLSLWHSAFLMSLSNCQLTRQSKPKLMRSKITVLIRMQHLRVYLFG